MELYIWRSFSNGSDGTAASVAVMLLGAAGVLIGLSLWVRRRAAHMRTGGRAGLVVGLSHHSFLIVVCLAALYPLWFMVSTALKTNVAYQLNPTGLPTHPSFDALRSMVGRPAAAPLDVE